MIHLGSFLCVVGGVGSGQETPFPQRYPQTLTPHTHSGQALVVPGPMVPRQSSLSVVGDGSANLTSGMCLCVRARVRAYVLRTCL